MSDIVSEKRFPFAEFEDITPLLGNGFDFETFLSRLEKYQFKGINSLFYYVNDKSLIVDEVLSILSSVYALIPDAKYDDKRFEDFFTLNYSIDRIYSLLELIQTKTSEYLDTHDSRFKRDYSKPVKRHQL